MEWGGAPAVAAPESPSDLEGERSRRTVSIMSREIARHCVALRLGLLQWAVGGFCGIIGALTFVTPHQFVGPAYRLLRPYLPWWGLLCLIGAGALITIALLSPRPRLTMLAHALAAAPILLLTTGDAALRIWRSAWAWMPVDAGRGLFRLAWFASAVVCLALIVVAGAVVLAG